MICMIMMQITWLVLPALSLGTVICIDKMFDELKEFQQWRQRMEATNADLSRRLLQLEQQQSSQQPQQQPHVTATIHDGATGQLKGRGCGCGAGRIMG
jgi:cytochrome c-type biogenesis protein CcmH/NrfG